jgi:ribose transport system ATP-binding protein
VTDVQLAASGPGTDTVLSMAAIVKFYGTNKVLSNVDFSVAPGEIVGLVGANGAGKTTLLKILSGIISPTSGTMAFAGENVNFSAYDPTEAWKHGVAMVHQGLSLCTNLAVWENWSLRYGRVSWKKRSARLVEAEQALESTFPASNISPKTSVGELSLAQRQMVEIARATSHPWLKLLVLDEPTSALSGESSIKLHNYLKQMVSRGASAIYVTHKLDEILGLADRLVALRNGEVCWTGDGRHVSRSQLVEELGGRVLNEGGTQPADSQAGRRPTTPRVVVSPPGSAIDENAPDETGVIVRVQGLYTNRLKAVNVTARAAEIVGLAGLEGAGQRDLLQAVWKRGRGAARGRVTVAGSLAYVAGDRDGEGTFPLWDIYNNILIGAIRLKRAVRASFIRWRRVDVLVQDWFAALDIAASSPKVNIRSLSGGNQQKVLLARAFASEAQVLLLDDPTRGVDVGTKAAVYAALEKQKASGRTVIVYSTEDAEFNYCDRVYVFAEGRISGELAGGDISGAAIVSLSYEHGQTSAELPTYEPTGRGTGSRTVVRRRRRHPAPTKTDAGQEI